MKGASWVAQVALGAGVAEGNQGRGYETLDKREGMDRHILGAGPNTTSLLGVVA